MFSYLLDSQLQGWSAHFVLVIGKKRGPSASSSVKHLPETKPARRMRLSCRRKITGWSEKTSESRKRNKRTRRHTCWIMMADEEEISHLWGQWLDHKYSHICVSGKHLNAGTPVDDQEGSHSQISCTEQTGCLVRSLASLNTQAAAVITSKRC